MSSQNGQDPDMVMHESSSDRRERYTSTRGVVAIFSPMPPMLQNQIVVAMGNQGFEKPPVPTYEVSTFGDDVEVHEHDEDSIKDDPEAEAAWEEYKEGVAAYDDEFQKRLTLACQLRCMELPGFEDEQWQLDQERIGLDVPQDPIDKKIHYIDTEFAGAREDYLAIVQKPLILTMAKSGVLEAAEEMFRKALMEEEETPEGSEADIGEPELELAGNGTDGDGDVEPVADGIRLEDETE